MRVAILLSGSGSNMDALARSMTGDHPARPVLVVSDVPDAGGLARAARLGIPTATIPSAGRSRAAFEADLHGALDAARPDLVALAGFMRVLSADIVERFRMINVHPSLLPRHPGLRTHRRALEAGDREHGCTVHVVTPALDAGPILGRARVRVEPGDTEASLAARVLAAEHRLYPAVLRRVAEGRDGVIEL